MFNTDARGLRKVLQPREEKALQILWRGSASTTELAEAMEIRGRDVLRILGRLQEQGIVDAREDYTLGKARLIWNAKVNQSELLRMVTRRLIRVLLEDWPEVREVLVEEAAELMKEAGRRVP